MSVHARLPAVEATTFPREESNGFRAAAVHNGRPMRNLDQLASDWLAPEKEEDFSLPAITNETGMVQATWGVAGIQNWIHPPTGMATPTGLLFHEVDGRIRRFSSRPSFRWRAYEIERSGGGVSSATRVCANKPAVIERLRFEHSGVYYLVFGGLPRTWSFASYWNLPALDVPMRNVARCERGFALTDTKTFGTAQFAVPGELSIHADLQAWLDGDAPLEHGSTGVARLSVSAGDEITWYGVQGCEEELATVEPGADWRAARVHWEELWQEAFRPDNSRFSGHLPAPRGEFERLYATSVVTLLACRRLVPPRTARSQVTTGGQCIWNEAGANSMERVYVWGGPEGGMTTIFLWELELQAALLARLDPAALRAELDAMIRVGLHSHWGFESVSGAGAGMGYGVNAGAFLSAVRDYVRISGDRAWALERLEFLRGCARPELTDYGGFQRILECVKGYEHGVASFQALAVQGLRFLAELTGEQQYARSASVLAKQVIELWAGGPFACLQPDGSRRVVRTVLDFVYVARCMGDDVPEPMRRGMLEFFERELRTKDWLYALSPSDEGALTRELPSFQSFRGDHQATGSYDGWAARAASVLLRWGERERALEWLRAIQALTREGPFGQAHNLFDGGARKSSFFNGNCYLNSAGAAFATTLLEDLEVCP